MSVWNWFDLLNEILLNLQAAIYLELGIWSYILLAVLVATEGPLSTLIGASGAAAGLLDWRWVLAATVAGNVVGDCLWYSVGYLGKIRWLYEHGRWLGLRPHHVARLEREMRTHATKLIVFAKIAYGLIVPTLIAAGLARVNWRKWFPVVFVVETLWSILLVWVGYHTTVYIQDFEQTLHAIGVAVFVGGGMLILMRLLRNRIDQEELELDPLHPVKMEGPGGILSSIVVKDDPAGVRIDVNCKDIASIVEPYEAKPRETEADEGDEVHQCTALPSVTLPDHRIGHQGTGSYASGVGGTGLGGGDFVEAPVVGKG